MTNRTAPGTPHTAPQASQRRGYGRFGQLWQRMPGELGFLLLGLPIAIAGLVVFLTLVSLGLSLALLVGGLFVLAGALCTARVFGTLELRRLRATGQPEITAPRWPVVDPARGLWSRGLAPLRDGASWRYLLHSFLVQPVIGITTWCLTITWLATGLGGVSNWFWIRFIPMTGENILLHRIILDWLFPGNNWDIDPVLGENLLYLLAGIIALATLPLMTRLLTLAHQAAARGLLFAGKANALRAEVAALAAARGAAVQAEDQSLRRLERDIHDGPQQRLVRLQMDLASAERTLERDPEAARGLLGEAREQARDTLEELRALSRGFAPPILQDRGLAAGLESLAARSPIATQLNLELGDEPALAPEIERSVYFVAAELLTNAAKHSQASELALEVSLEDSRADEGELVLRVTDNGVGGAELQNGHGLSGLADRLHGLRGELGVESPVGGPTRVTARIPLAGTSLSGDLEPEAPPTDTSPSR